MSSKKRFHLLFQVFLKFVANELDNFTVDYLFLLSVKA
jgi:hypothetical protein